jgi:hypothetical protein
VQRRACEFTAIHKRYSVKSARTGPGAHLLRPFQPLAPIGLAIRENPNAINIFANIGRKALARLVLLLIGNCRRFPIAHWLHSKQQKGPESTGFEPFTAPLFGAELCRFNADLVIPTGFEPVLAR